MSTLPDQISSAILQVIDHAGNVAPLHVPTFEGNEWTYVKQCIDTGWVSSAGKFVDEFEERLAAYAGVERAVAVVNGTAALHIALKTVGVEPEHEVLMPALTFVATANAVHYCGAIPHFIDISETTLGVDVVKLEDYLKKVAVSTPEGCINKHTGRKISAIVVVHTFGHPVDMEPLAALARQYMLPIVEDAAEALGTLYHGRHIGQHSSIAALSFNGNKILTTGGGGALLCRTQELADRVKHLTTTAKRPHKWAYYHDEVGYNYRMPNINAALGCAQLEQLDEFILRKRQLAASYANVFQSIDGVKFFEEPSFARSNYWLNAILLEDESIDLRVQRDEVLEVLHQARILARPAWQLMNELPMYETCPSDTLVTSESIASRLINIPSSVSLVPKLEGIVPIPTSTASV